MKELTKGAIALSAATALLLGGAGSIAYWSASTATTASDFTMGDLQVTAASVGAWRDQDGAAVDPATARLIPGSQIRFVRDFEVVATGDGLLVKATFEDSTLTYGPGTATPTLSIELGSDDGIVAEEGSGVYRVTGSGTVTATATLTVPATETTRKNGQITAGIGTLLLQQVAAFDN